MSAVGIDLGTTYSAVAAIDAEGRPFVIADVDGERTVASVVCFRHGEVVVGNEAKALLALGGNPGQAFFKRGMGDPHFVCRTPIGDLTAVDLSALVLRRLKMMAETRLGHAVTQAVITVPAYFRDPERRATIAAGEAAGLQVLQVINEPTAAAMAYGFGGSRGFTRILVYDLGGGTFDVTLLTLNRDRIDVVSSDGDHELGGKDWDDRLMESVAARFDDEHGTTLVDNPLSFADLRSRAEAVKRQLSAVRTATVSLVHDGHRGRYEVSREQFEGLTSDLLGRTIALTSKVLRENGFGRNEIDGVLLVGGSTRMPMVRDAIEREIGKAPLDGVNVDEAVALGAALVAEDAATPGSATIAFRDVTNHSLGMIAVNAVGDRYVNTIILPKNASLPCQETRPFQFRTRSSGDNELEVYVTQGESESSADVAYLGRYVISDVPHDSSGPVVLDVSYSYDHSATVKVESRVRATGHMLPVRMESLPVDVPARFLSPPSCTPKSDHVTVYLAFDVSGSMCGAPLAAAQEAARGFLQNCDLAHCSIGLIAVSDRVKILHHASQNARRIRTAVDSLRAAETGIGNAADPFREVLQLAEGVAGKVFTIVLADGVWDHQNLAVQRAKLCHAANVDIIAIGFGGADQAFLGAIASCDTAGFMTSLGGVSEVFSTIAQVITETSDADSDAIGRRLRIGLRGLP